MPDTFPAARSALTVLKVLAARGGPLRATTLARELGVPRRAQCDRPQPVPVPPEERPERLRVTGDVRYDTLTIEQGAVVDGRLSPNGAAEARPTLQAVEDGLVLPAAAE